MIEKIYTIPVSEAFEVKCECPVCLLEKRFEEERIAYYLGSSLMEPDNRVETNKYGFCRNHFEMLFNKKSNALGLALMLETHLSALIKELGNIYKDGSPIPSAGRLKALFNSSGDGSKSLDAISSVISFVSKLEKECCVCKSLEYTMARYIEVIFHLWKTEPDFKKLYSAQSGFCLPHLRLMLQNSGKYLSSRERDEFLQETMKMQMENLGRIRDEVHWFTQKFDYRYKDEPWGNSKDAVQRAVQKLAGYMKLDG